MDDTDRITINIAGGGFHSYYAQIEALLQADIPATYSMEPEGPCCDIGERQGFMSWLRRMLGRAHDVYEVIPVTSLKQGTTKYYGVSRRSMRVQKKGAGDMYALCVCGKWSPYDKVFPREESKYRFHARQFHDSRDANSLVDKLSNGIPVKWPLWVASGFGLLGVVGLFIEARC